MEGVGGWDGWVGGKGGGLHALLYVGNEWVGGWVGGCLREGGGQGLGACLVEGVGGWVGGWVWLGWVGGWGGRLTRSLLACAEPLKRGPALSVASVERGGREGDEDLGGWVGGWVGRLTPAQLNQTTFFSVLTPPLPPHTHIGNPQ